MRSFVPVIFLLLIHTITVSACDCKITPIENHIQNTPYIITGEVVELLKSPTDDDGYDMSRADHSFKVKFKLTMIYKGELKENTVIEISSNFTNCDIYYKLGEKYLLFLLKENDEYKSRICSYSEKLVNAEEYITSVKRALGK